jgi:nicotinate phosphoribosyltransferase
MADRDFGIPASGTMAHSWVQSFDTELEAFETYARLYPERSIFLVDTYNVIHSGLPNAIKAMREQIVPRGFRPVAIRIDSGDITYISKVARKMLDAAGFPDCKILVSNSLDEYIIEDIIAQGAQIDMFGVGEKLITSQSEPVFGGVYKLAGIGRADGGVEPKLKVSENVEKITTPGDKQAVRLFDRKTSKAIADVLILADEVIDESQPYLIFDPENTWKRKLITDFYAKPLLELVFRNGECVYSPPPLSEVRDYCREQVGHLWEEVLRFENPQKYFVDLSQKLWDLKYGMLHELSKSNAQKP